MKEISIVKAEYIEEYKIELTFNDGKKNVIDFDPLFKKYLQPQYSKYLKKQYFIKFKIDNGMLVWGRDWDVIFSTDMLYKIKSKPQKDGIRKLPQSIKGKTITLTYKLIPDGNWFCVKCLDWSCIITQGRSLIECHKNCINATEMFLEDLINGKLKKSQYPHIKKHILEKNIFLLRFDLKSGKHIEIKKFDFRKNKNLLFEFSQNGVK